MPDRPLAAPKPPLVERVLGRCAGQCAVCRAWSHQTVCAACLLHYAAPVARCHGCGMRLPAGLADPAQRCGRCVHEPPPFDRVVAALDYRFPWDRLLQQFKYRDGLALREALAARLDAALGAAAVDAPDCLLPVPLSAERLRERGYNQAHELARALAQRRGLRCEPAWLLRVRHNDRQAGLKLDERTRNVRGVFALEPLQAARLQGAHVALVDDVMTSGATLAELARVLRHAGVGRVQAWVVARTPEPGE